MGVDRPGYRDAFNCRATACNVLTFARNSLHEARGVDPLVHAVSRTGFERFAEI